MKISVIKSILLYIFLCILRVEPMALKGPPITRYDPCGLALIHFEKITENLWQGVLHLGIFNRDYSEFEIEINFEKRVTIYAATQNRTFSVMNDGLDYLIKPKGLKSKRYIFYLSLNEEGVNKIPAVKKLALNKAILCDDTIKAEKLRRQLNVCGRRTLEHSELSSVRTYAKAGDWPWHVALLLKDITTNTSQYRCGGNIISTTAVLTAGHCLSINGFTVEASRVIIIAGVSNITDMNQLGRQERIATRIIIHPAFIYEQATSDLAIVKVADFRFTQYVQPVCVWGPLYDKSSLFGQEAVVVGFGLTENNKFSDTLRSAYTMVQNDFTCIAYSPILYNGLLNEFTFCAGFGPTSGINPRNGDSGGGLVVAKAHPDYKVTWFLRGVVSHCGITPNQKECDPKFYHVYTDVGPHYGWIYHNVGFEH